MKSSTRRLTHAAVTSALYIVLTLLSNLFGLSRGAVQLRLSEALCILPIFTPAAVPGLFIGCLLSNIFTGSPLPDIVFGGLATLLGAVFTERLKARPILAVIPPIIANTVILPPVIVFAYSLPGALWYYILTVFLSEAASCGVLGLLLHSILKKYPIKKSF